MATIVGVNLSTPKILAEASDSIKIQTLKFSCVNKPWKTFITSSPDKLSVSVRHMAAAAAPGKLSDKVAESVKAAEETCGGDPESGECAAAWDEVEELSAAASHSRDRRLMKAAHMTTNFHES